MQAVALIILLVSVSFQSVFAQYKVFFNSVPIDPERYQEVSGSPYLYQKWKLATLITRDSTIYDNVLLNFNGYEQKIEVKQSSKVISLDDDLYDLITVSLPEVNKNQQEWFIRGVHFDIAMQLTNVIYNSQEIKLIRSFQVRISESSNEIYGDASVRKKFVTNDYYSILYKSKLQAIRASNRSIGKVFESKELVSSLVNENNLNLSVEADLIRLMSLIEAQILQ